MCRLYTFRSNHPRKVECELIEAQNSLLAQSTQDARGESNLDGWGLGTYHDGAPRVVRQAEPANESQDFRREAGRVHTTNVIAHVRRATVGVSTHENTHPFTFHSSIMAHNGTIGPFYDLRPRMIEQMTGHHRTAVLGSTDSEHFFHLLLSRREQYPDDDLADSLRRTMSDVVAMSEQIDPHAELALNIILTDGEVTVGSRLGRSLYAIEREEVHACLICDGAIHIQSEPTVPYRAVVIASEIITTDEEWEEVREGTVWRIDGSIRLTRSAL